MAEWSNAAVLKTVDVKASGGSNPSLSAEMQLSAKRWAVFIFPPAELARAWEKWLNVKNRLFCILSVTGTKRACVFASCGASAADVWIWQVAAVLSLRSRKSWEYTVASDFSPALFFRSLPQWLPSDV